VRVGVDVERDSAGVTKWMLWVGSTMRGLVAQQAQRHATEADGSATTGGVCTVVNRGGWRGSVHQ
jgi:hypothetical protein